MFSIEHCSEINNETIIKKYNDKNFLEFIRVPLLDLGIQDKIELKLSENVEYTFKGVIGQIILNHDLIYNTEVGKSILFQAGTIIEYYRSLKPNKIEYKKYLDNLFGSEIDVLYDKKDTIGVYIIEIDS